MNLTLSEEQILIKESAKKYLESHYSFEKRRVIIEENPSYYLNHWKEFAELGWLGLPFPEEFGGFGDNINNLMTLMECFGANLTLEPIIFNNLIIGKVVQNFNLNKTASILEDIISGNKLYSFLFSPTDNYKNIILDKLKIKKNKENAELNGSISCVFGIERFDFILIPVLSNEKIFLYLIAGNKNGLEIKNYETIDNMKCSNIEFNSLELNNNELIIDIDKDEFFEKFDYIFDLATLAVCSQALGVIDKMYDLTLEYCKTRQQFGKNIGSFQVIQHRLVDMYIIKEEMRSLNYMAQVTINDKKEVRKKNISLNKIFLGSRAKAMSQDCIQIHGGMGVAKEMSIGHYFSKITALGALFGSTDYHKERYAGNDIF